MDQKGSEQSAQFILSIIEEIGKENYHDLVYMTNISWHGFTKGGNNLNYHELPLSLHKTFTRSFIKEMNIVQPAMIVPLSIKVEETLKQMVNDGELKYPLATSISRLYQEESRKL